MARRNRKLFKGYFRIGKERLYFDEELDKKLGRFYDEMAERFELSSEAKGATLPLPNGNLVPIYKVDVQTDLMKMQKKGKVVIDSVGIRLTPVGKFSAEMEMSDEESDLNPQEVENYVLAAGGMIKWAQEKNLLRYVGGSGKFLTTDGESVLKSLYASGFCPQPHLLFSCVMKFLEGKKGSAWSDEDQDMIRSLVHKYLRDIRV